jgi:hypothetical protein
MDFENLDPTFLTDNPLRSAFDFDGNWVKYIQISLMYEFLEHLHTFIYITKERV